MDNATIIDNHELAFDPDDPLNGSLYVCVPPGNADALEPIVACLRKAALWSATGFKTVPNEHRDAYKEQLQFVAATHYQNGTAPFMLTRFDHSKYPSDADRYAAWVEACDSAFTRVE